MQARPGQMLNDAASLPPLCTLPLPGAWRQPAAVQRTRGRASGSVFPQSAWDGSCRRLQEVVVL